MLESAQIQSFDKVVAVIKQFHGHVMLHNGLFFKLFCARLKHNLGFYFYLRNQNVDLFESNSFPKSLICRHEWFCIEFPPPANIRPIKLDYVHNGVITTCAYSAQAKKFIANPYELVRLINNRIEQVTTWQQESSKFTGGSKLIKAFTD